MNTGRRIRIQRELEEKQKEEERLRQQAIHDMLTGLYNRQYAEEKIASLMEQKVRFIICFLDLDGLKTVNDRYGHEAGDWYIQTAVEQVRHVCRNREDILFRYGGDEFLVLFQGMTVKTAEERMKALNDNLGNLKEERFSMSVSYGVAESTVYPGWKELIRDADRKMYEQKQDKPETLRRNL